MKKSYLLGLLPLTLFSAPAAALDVPCTTPTTPTLPAQLTSAADVQSYESQTVTVLDTSGTYYQCLISFAEDNNATLTDADRTELRNLYDAQVARVKTYSENWNALYSAYISTE